MGVFCILQVLCADVKGAAIQLSVLSTFQEYGSFLIEDHTLYVRETSYTCHARSMLCAWVVVWNKYGFSVLHKINV